MRGSEGCSGSVLDSPKLGLVSDARPPLPLGRSLRYPWLLCIDVATFYFVSPINVYVRIRSRPLNPIFFISCGFMYTLLFCCYNHIYMGVA